MNKDLSFWRHRNQVLILFAFFIMLAGCRPGATDKSGDQVTEEALSTPCMEAILSEAESRVFQLVDWEAVENFESLVDLMHRPVEIEFLEGGKFAAQGPVNRLMGTMTVAEDGYLEVDKRIASTMMAGPEALMELERKMIEELANVSELVLDNKHLALVNPGGGVLHFEEIVSARD